MELELIVKKRRWWQPKWEKTEPIIYVLEKTEDNNTWFNTFWWDGNCGGSKSPVKFLEPNKIQVNAGGCRSILVIIGNTGTDLLLDNKVRKKGHTGNKFGWTCFGYFYKGQFIEKKERLRNLFS